jgi:hypothetical protein
MIEVDDFFKIGEPSSEVDEVIFIGIVFLQGKVV